jgi:LysM repeat protein
MKRIWLSLSLAAALLVPGIKAVSAGQEHPAPTVDYVVQPGDTLWILAGDLRPGEDRRRVVHELLELNDLRHPSLIPGQRIVLPAS